MSNDPRRGVRGRPAGNGMRLRPRDGSAGGAAPAPPAPLPSFDGGGTFVDIADRDALYRAMEGR